MENKNQRFVESLLFSAISQIESDLNVKSVLFKQMFDLINNNNNNNDSNVISIDFKDKLLIEKYESMTDFYENCFNEHFNSQESNEQINNRKKCQSESTYDVSPSIRKDYDLVMGYANSERYEVAIPLCKQTLNKCQHWSEDEYRLSQLLAQMNYKCRKYAESEPHLRRALDIRQRSFGPNDRTCIEIKTKLSIVSFEEKRYQNSELFAKQLLNAIHENESDGNQELCIWELAEELQKYGIKDYSLVSVNNEHKFWYQIYDKYPNISRVLKNLSQIYEMNGKPIAAEVIRDVSSQLRQDMYGLNDDCPQKVYSQTKQQLMRRKTFPLIITDSIGCQTDDELRKDQKFVQKLPNVEIHNKNSLFRKKLMNALGIKNVLNEY